MDVSADFSGWGASFSASSDYKEVHENSVSHLYRYVSSHANCEAYVASVQINTMPLSHAFKKAVHDLPSESTNLEDYKDFIQHWGTHTVTTLTMGGRYGVQSSVTNDDYTSMASTGLDIKAAAKYSGIVSLNSDAATSSQKEQAEQFESYRTDYQIYQIGGKPPLNETTSTFEWAQTVKSNPLPLLYTLFPLTDYLTSQYFPNDKDISKKQSKLHEATTEYCQSLDLPDISYCMNDGPMSDPKIEVTFAKNFEIITCEPYVSHHHFVPILDNPYHRILGTLDSKLLANPAPVVIVNGNNPPDKLIRNANDWDRVYYMGSSSDDKLVSGFRPICDDDFLSVSDVLCCDDRTECFDNLPLTLPCIAVQCLTDCGYIKLYGHIIVEPPISVINFGNAVLGNDYYSNGTNFIRFAMDTTADEYKCLNFNCLQFI